MIINADGQIEITVNFKRGNRGSKRAVVDRTRPAKPTPVGRLPRVTRLMALAIRFEKLIRDGEVEDYAELARLGHVTRARITQIMNLTLLAPDIQEAILDLPRVTVGRDPITERDLRPIVAILEFKQQWHHWTSTSVQGHRVSDHPGSFER